MRGGERRREGEWDGEIEREREREARIVALTGLPKGPSLGDCSYCPVADPHCHEHCGLVQVSL